MANSIRTFFTLLLTAALAYGISYSNSAKAAQPKGPGVQVVVKGSVNDALDKLKKGVASNGMMVMGELHQGKVLEMTGIKVDSESVFIGNPNVGKKLFSLVAGAGLAVPVRLNLYKNKKGQTVISYVPLSDQLKAFNNPKVNKIAAMLDSKLEKLTKMLAR